jgi:hypothetical protein
MANMPTQIRPEQISDVAKVLRGILGPAYGPLESLGQTGAAAGEAVWQAFQQNPSEFAPLGGVLPAWRQAEKEFRSGRYVPAAIKGTEAMAGGLVDVLTGGAAAPIKATLSKGGTTALAAILAGGPGKKGNVIRGEFEKRLRSKKGLIHNPDLEIPVAKIDGEPFDRFEVKGGTIYGVRGDDSYPPGLVEKIGSTTPENAHALASAYNAGGYYKEPIETFSNRPFRMKRGGDDKPEQFPAGGRATPDYWLTFKSGEGWEVPMKINIRDNMPSAIPRRAVKIGKKMRKKQREERIKIARNAQQELYDWVKGEHPQFGGGEFEDALDAQIYFDELFQKANSGPEGRMLHIEDLKTIARITEEFGPKSEW